ncbi:MAG: RluA family pseudouridine synthase [Chloroflexota bacterium]
MQAFTLRFEGHHEQRLDHFLAISLPQFSRSRLQALIRRGSVLVGGEAASKAGQMIVPGAIVIVQVPAPAPSGLTPEKIALDVVFEDADVIVVNKPAGMVVHPGAGHRTGTLVNAALAHDPSMTGVGGEERPGVVHRLDKATSGLIVLAKNDNALRWLQEQFQARKVRKTYLALVDGKPPTASGRIDAAIGRDRAQRKQMSVLPEGKGREAITDYSTREVFARHALLEVHPVTGRTHQARLHCAFLGCPVAGDTVYGWRRPSISIGRHFLHAWKLEIALPLQRNRREFEAPLPLELEQVLVQLRAGNPAATR